MFSSASLHPVAYFAILAATFSYLYAQHRQLHLLLWGLSWTVLAVRQVLVAAFGSDRWVVGEPPRIWNTRNGTHP